MKLNQKDIKMNNYYSELLGILVEKTTNQKINVISSTDATEKK